MYELVRSSVSNFDSRMWCFVRCYHHDARVMLARGKRQKRYGAHERYCLLARWVTRWHKLGNAVRKKSVARA